MEEKFIKYLTIFVIVYLVVMLASFLYKKWKNRNHVLTRYKINSNHDAIKLLHDPKVSAEDKREIKAYMDLLDRLNSREN